MSDYRIPELALLGVLVSHYDGGKGDTDTWAARCMSAGGGVGRKDAILESEQAPLGFVLSLSRAPHGLDGATFDWLFSVDLW
jgi:hypothetical protein